MSGKRDPLRRIILFPDALRTVTGEINLTELPSELLLAPGTVGEGLAIIVGTLGVARDVAAGIGEGAFLPTAWFWMEVPVQVVEGRK